MRCFVKRTITSIAICVLAVAVAGCSSDDPAAPPAGDTSSPVVNDVMRTSRTRLVVKFSEEVDKETAQDPSNYTLVEVTPTPAYEAMFKWRARPEITAGAVVNVLSCVLQPGDRDVVMTTDPMQLFVPYALDVSGVADLAGNPSDIKTAAVADHSSNGRIFTIAGNGLAALGAENVDPKLSELYLPQDITVGPDGFLYVTDWNNHRIRVIENGLIRTIIGTGILGDADEGNALEVGLNHPTNVSFGPNGDLYMAGWHNSKIMKYDMTTAYLSVYCNRTGARGWYGDGGPAYNAIINLPSSTVWGPDGNLYISDQANFCIRMIDFDVDTITTVVAVRHRPGFEGDGGPAIDALLNAPSGQAADPASRIEFDSAGNLYLCDTSNHRIRVVDTNGIINTIAGNGLKGFSGDSGDATAAQLNYPADIAINPVDGNIYISDKNNHRIRMIDQQGIITTVVGDGTVGFKGEGGPAKDAGLYEPWGICFDAQGNLFIADTKTQRIRIVYR